MSQTDIDAAEIPDEDLTPDSVVLGLAAMIAAPLVLWGALAGGILSPATLFLPVVVPVAIWVAWHDMAHMKIPNAAFLVMFVSFAVLGLFAFPLSEYAFRWSHFVVVLVLGFVLNMGRLMGAGDAKFAAAIAPLFAVQDLPFVVRMFAALLLGAFVAHRLATRIPALKRLVPDWTSWTRNDFPMGLALSGLLLTYMVLLVFYGR